jgi:hypothetical protein
LWLEAFISEQNLWKSRLLFVSGPILAHSCDWHKNMDFYVYWHKWGQSAHVSSIIKGQKVIKTGYMVQQLVTSYDLQLNPHKAAECWWNIDLMGPSLVFLCTQPCTFK